MDLEARAAISFDKTVTGRSTGKVGHGRPNHGKNGKTCSVGSHVASSDTLCCTCADAEHRCRLLEYATRLAIHHSSPGFGQFMPRQTCKLKAYPTQDPSQALLRGIARICRWKRCPVTFLQILAGLFATWMRPTPVDMGRFMCSLRIDVLPLTDSNSENTVRLCVFSNL